MPQLTDFLEIEMINKFFSYICEEEVLHVVEHLSNKTSTDCNNISMVFIKNALINY